MTMIPLTIINTRQEIYFSFISLPSDIMETDLVFLLVYIYMIVISTRYRCKFLFLSSNDKYFILLFRTTITV